jgi:hypothetical protein
LHCRRGEENISGVPRRRRMGLCCAREGRRSRAERGRIVEMKPAVQSALSRRKLEITLMAEYWLVPTQMYKQALPHGSPSPCQDEIQLKTPRLHLALHHPLQSARSRAHRMTTRHLKVQLRHQGPVSVFAEMPACTCLESTCTILGTAYISDRNKRTHKRLSNPLPCHQPAHSDRQVGHPPAEHHAQLRYRANHQ